LERKSKRLTVKNILDSVGTILLNRINLFVNIYYTKYAQRY